MPEDKAVTPDVKPVAETTAKITSEVRKSLAYAILNFMQWTWFADSIKPTPDPVLAQFLMNIYVCALRGDPPHKKAAWQAVGIQDIKTGRKYISQAEKLGLVEIRRSPDDRRKELLHPTPLFVRAVEPELQLLDKELRRLRPWGSYQNSSDPYVVEHLVLEPGKNLYHSKHFDSSFHLVALKGTGVVTVKVGTKLQNHFLFENKSIYIPFGKIDRLSILAQSPLELVQVEVRRLGNQAESVTEKASARRRRRS